VDARADDQRGGALADAVTRSAIVRRLRLRVFGGRPAVRRRWSSAWRASKEASTRLLRTTNRHVSIRVIGPTPIRRHQPLEMSFEAGSLTVEFERSAALRLP
jgi:hypothetical protein